MKKGIISLRRSQSQLWEKNWSKSPFQFTAVRNRGKRVSLPTPDGTVYALIDYAGCITDWIRNQYANSPLPTDQELKRTWPSIIIMGGHFDHFDPDGGSVYVTYPKVRVVDVTDGLSKTILVMEKAVNVDHYKSSGKGDEYWEEPGWASFAFRSHDASRS